MKSINADELLGENEIADVQTLVDELQPAQYLIGQIHGGYWDVVKHDGSYAKRFKKSVQLGHVKHLSWIKTKSDNNELYLVE